MQATPIVVVTLTVRNLRTKTKEENNAESQHHCPFPFSPHSLSREDSEACGGSQANAKFQNFGCFLKSSLTPISFRTEEKEKKKRKKETICKCKKTNKQTNKDRKKCMVDPFWVPNYLNRPKRKKTFDDLNVPLVMHVLCFFSKFYKIMEQNI